MSKLVRLMELKMVNQGGSMDIWCTLKLYEHLLQSFSSSKSRAQLDQSLPPLVTTRGPETQRKGNGTSELPSVPPGFCTSCMPDTLLLPAELQFEPPEPTFVARQTDTSIPE
jgi:hypothetical protein